MNTAHQIKHLIQMHRPKDIRDTTSRPGFILWKPGCAGCPWQGQDHDLHLTRLICSIDSVPTPEEWWHQDRPEVGWQAGPGPNEELADQWIAHDPELAKALEPRVRFNRNMVERE